MSVMVAVLFPLPMPELDPFGLMESVRSVPPRILMDPVKSLLPLLKYSRPGPALVSPELPAGQLTTADISKSFAVLYCRTTRSPFPPP